MAADPRAYLRPAHRAAPAGPQLLPYPGFGTLARQFRHLGDIQACYTAAITTGRMDFSVQPKARDLERSRDDLATHLRRQDDDLLAVLRDLTPEQQARTIDWDGEALTLLQHLQWLLAHETLHHGMWAVYARVAELPLPESWRKIWTLS